MGPSLPSRDAAIRLVVLSAAVACAATSCPEPECAVDADCQDPCDRGFALFADAGPLVAPALSAVRCQAYAESTPDHSVSDRPHCTCAFDSGGSHTLWGDDEFCLVVARNSQCLLNASELPFDLCVPGDDSSCQPPCAALRDRLADDAARPIVRSLVGPRCPEGGSLCHCIVAIDGACFEQGVFARAPDGPDDEVPCP